MVSDTEKKARIWAAAGTLGACAIVLLLLLCCNMSVYSLDMPDSREAEIILEQEEFIEVQDFPSLPDMDGQEAARAQADETLPSQPTPISGSDVEDAGAPGNAAPLVSSAQESPVKEKVKDKTPQAPSQDPKKKEEEEIKRKADNEVANAFNRSDGKHNNASSSSDSGNNGVPSGNAPQGSLTGRGSGSVGGGWNFPNYASVPSTVTGSVKMVATIDRYGNVVSLRFDGGDAPAATNTAVKNACAAEVKARKFTRSNPDDAPETSRAYITYTFK